MIDCREEIKAVLGKLAPEATPRQVGEAVRALIKIMTAAMMGDGYTIGMVAEALGLPETTLRTWRDRDPAFKVRCEQLADKPRRWLLGQLRLQLESGGKAAGQAANILANLWAPELRSSKVEAQVTNVDPAESRRRVLDTVNRGREPDVI